MTATATADTTAATKLDRAFKHEDCVELLYLLSECGPQVASNLEIASRQPRAALDLALNQLMLFELVGRDWVGRSFVYSIAAEHAKAIKKALAAYQKAGRFTFVLRDPPRPKAKGRGIAIMGVCR